jgi:integrase
MRAWARYTKDDVLAARLSDIRETLPVPRKVNPKKPLSADERERFLRSLDRREKDPYVVALLGLLATRGLRVSDVLRLTRKEVNYGVKEGVLPVETKGGVRQEFYLAEDAVAYLRVFQDVTRAHDGAPEWKTVLDLVAPAANHKTDRRRAALTIVGRACKRVALAAKVKATPHILRHTVARLFLDTVSQDMAQLVAYMGWLRPETAFNYISFVDPAKLRDAAEKMKRRS